MLLLLQKVLQLILVSLSLLHITNITIHITTTSTAVPPPPLTTATTVSTIKTNVFHADVQLCLLSVLHQYFLYSCEYSDRGRACVRWSGCGFPLTPPSCGACTSPTASCCIPSGSINTRKQNPDQFFLTSVLVPPSGPRIRRLICDQQAHTRLPMRLRVCEDVFSDLNLQQRLINMNQRLQSSTLPWPGCICWRLLQRGRRLGALWSCSASDPRQTRLSNHERNKTESPHPMTIKHPLQITSSWLYRIKSSSSSSSD